MTNNPKDTAPVSSTASEPLLNANDNDDVRPATSSSIIVEHSIGGHTYRVDPTQTRSKTTWWGNALKVSCMMVLSPVLIPTALLYTTSMYIGPSWWRHKMTKLLVSVAMNKVDTIFHHDRQILLEHVPQGATVLDLGAGSGYYLQYLSGKAKRVIAIEPVANLHKQYRQLATKAGFGPNQIECHACDIETYLEDHPNAVASIDWVLLGNVLCEVANQPSTLDCVNHLLKPGGHIYFSEHIAAAKGTWARWFQDLVNPIWRTAGAGCNCNRDSLIHIQAMPEWRVIHWVYPHFRVALGSFVLGLAYKKTNDDQQDKQ